MNQLSRSPLRIARNYYAAHGIGKAYFSSRLGDVNSTRKAFGSFHSEDIETLVNTPDLQPPSIMQELLENAHGNIKVRGYESLSFGVECREQLFSLDPSWTFLNHGAFGGVMKPQMEAAEYWRRHCESQPLRFYDRELFPLIAYSVQQAAKHFHCPANELYPLQNVTTGLNCVLQSIQLSPGDEVVCLSLTYGSTKKMLQDVCQRSGAILRIVHLPLPIQDEQAILSKFPNALNDRTRLVIIDQITSNTALVLPTLAMARLAKEAGALVVVDAAHAMMSTDVSIYPADTKLDVSAVTAAGADTDHGRTSVHSISQSTTQGLCSNNRHVDALSDVADVWLTNAHKWFSAPKGCAFMWVRPEVATHLRPPVVSHGYQARETTWVGPDKQVRWWHERKDGSAIARPAVATGGADAERSAGRARLLSALAWDGCRDYASLLCVPVGLQIWGALGNCHSVSPQGNSDTISSTVAVNESEHGAAQEGMARCRVYMRTLLHDQVVPMLKQEWNLRESDFAGPASMRRESPMVLIPLPQVVLGLDTTKNTTDKHAFALQEILHHEHRFEAPVKCLEGRLYLRLSAHIYNTLDQYQHLAHSIGALK